VLPVSSLTNFPKPANLTKLLLFCSGSTQGCVISCVEEIEHFSGVCLLAVAIEFTSGNAGAGMISVFCVQGSKILRSMDFCEKITSCSYIKTNACDKKNILKNFNGTIAIGTEQGKLFIIDLMLPKNVRGKLLAERSFSITNLLLSF